jgi:TPR repeat protein
MIAYIDRWILLVALAAGHAATPPLAARAQSLEQTQESVGYALTDALMPYAQRNYGRALALLAPLAEQGNAVAQLKLGIIFSCGKTGSPDHVAALGWFTKAAEQGQVDAQFELGRIYRDGLGTRVDGNAAVSWLERAAAKDTPHALNALGELIWDTRVCRGILPSPGVGSCAARRRDILRPCTTSALSTRSDTAWRRMRSRR